MKPGASMTLALVMALLSSAYTARTPQSEPLRSTDVGVSADTIRIGVIADVDNPVRPGLLQGAVDGVRAFAKFVNREGGLAGRRVQVDFLDSRLSADGARDALIEACARDFAIVGTSALLLNNIEPMIRCPDKAGRITGLPDIPVAQTEIVHQCSPTSYPVFALGIHCATKDDPEPRFDVRLGQIHYYEQHYEDLHGIFLMFGDFKSVVNGTLPTVRGTERAGIESDGELRVSALAPQTSYGPYVQTLKEQGSTYAFIGTDYRAGVFLRREANVQGATSVDVWDCPLACYDRRFLAEGGTDVEGQYVWILFLPFEEAKQSKSVARFLRFVGGADNADAFSAQAWTAGLFFRDAVNRVVKADGKNGLTRSAFFEQATTIHAFTADGMLGPTDVGRHKAGGCFVLLQAKEGSFVRVHPAKKGTFDCSSGIETLRVHLE